MSYSKTELNPFFTMRRVYVWQIHFLLILKYFY